MRGNLGYYERALEKNHPLILRLATPETLDTDMDAFFLLHQKRWRGRLARMPSQQRYALLSVINEGGTNP